MKNGFFFETIQPILRSNGVTVPSVSWPTTMNPFSARRTCIASVPYGVMPNGTPAAITASHAASPHQFGTLTSKASSPEKLTRTIRAGMPAMSASRIAMKGKLSLSTASSGASVAITSRDFGPTTAIVTHCSVTDVSRTRRSGHSVWRYSSMWSSTFAAPPVVVVQR